MINIEVLINNISKGKNMKAFQTLFLLLAVACGDTDTEEKDTDDTGEEEEESICPTPEEDECQTEELFAECEAELADCDGAVSWRGFQIVRRSAATHFHIGEFRQEFF